MFDVGRAPGGASPTEAPTCRVIKLEDEPSPPKVGRLLALRPDLRVLGGLGAIMLLEELRRGAVGTMTGFGFPEVLVAIVGRYRAGDEAGARAVFDRFAAAHPVREPAGHQPGHPQAPLPASRGDRDRDGCALRERPWTRARSPISTWSSRASGWRLTDPRPRAGRGSSRRRPGRSPRSRTTPPATAGTPRAGRARAGRRSGRAGCARSSGAGSPRRGTPAARRPAPRRAGRCGPSPKRPGARPLIRTGTISSTSDLIRPASPGRMRFEVVRPGIGSRDRARQDDQDRPGRGRRGGAAGRPGGAGPRSTACRRWRSARPPRRGPRTGPAAGRRS